MHIGAEVYYNLKNVIKRKYRMDATNVSNGDRFVPNILENKRTLGAATIEKSSYTDQGVISMVLAASEFFRYIVEILLTLKYIYRSYTFWD
ncbi:hypothetical protein STEG23_009278 [Scotinomys teguina]